MNVGIAFKTPEEYFKGQEPEEYELGFDPSSFVSGK